MKRMAASSKHSASEYQLEPEWRTPKLNLSRWRQLTIFMRAECVSFMLTFSVLRENVEYSDKKSGPQRMTDCLCGFNAQPSQTITNRMRSAA